MKLPLKIITALLLWGVATFSMNVFQPGITRDIALTQLDNTDNSFTNYAAWRELLSYSWVLYILPVLLFIPEMKGFIKTKKESGTKE